MSGLTNVGIWARRLGVAAVGGALILSSLGMGGCNNKLKEENEMLRTENAELKERSTVAEQRASSVTGQIDALSRQNQDLSSQLAAKNQELAARSAPPQQPAADGTFYGTDSAARTGGSPARSGGARSGGGSRTIEISGDVLFASGQVSLKTDAKRELDGVVRRIQREFPDSDLIIEGHTDSDPIRKLKGKYPTNEALSKARADAVAAYLVQKGISRSRIDTVGKGASEPRKTKAASRRVEIVVVN